MLVLEARGIRRMDRLSFSPTGRELVAGEWAGVCAWSLDALSGGEARAFDGVNGLGHLPDGRLVVGTRGGLFIRVKPHTFRRIQFEPRTFTVVSPVSPVVVTDSTCHRVTATGSLHPLWTDPEPVQYPPTISADGEWLATPCDGGYGIRIASLLTGRIVRTVSLSDALPHLVVSPDRNCFASLFYNHIRCWRVGRSQQVQTFAGETADDVSALAFHPSGRHLAAACHDHTVKFYDADTGQLAHAFAWDIGRLRSVAFSPDGTLAAAGSDTGKVVVWDVDV